MARLLGQHMIVGECPADGRDDGRLRQVVGFGHHIEGALLDDVLEPFVVVDLDRRGGASSLDGDRKLGGERSG